ncbi:MAG TPA: hypothetical protein VL490_01730 [Mucilaginibacter sp.]|nr:hypothetical protein [Mucilaginibacter sp.]
MGQVSIDKPALIQQISTTIGKLKVLELSRILKEQQFALRDLIDITFHPDKNIAFRAAWLLENIFLKHPESFLPDMEYLLGKIHEVKYPSCQRHYAKIVMHLTGKKMPKLIKDKLQTVNFEPIIEQLFEWLISPGVKIAVKVFAAEALFNLREQYDWIKEELVNQLQYLMRDGSAAIQSRGKRLLCKL